MGTIERDLLAHTYKKIKMHAKMLIATEICCGFRSIALKQFAKPDNLRPAQLTTEKKIFCKSITLGSNDLPIQFIRIVNFHSKK